MYVNNEQPEKNVQKNGSHQLPPVTPTPCSRILWSASHQSLASFIDTM